LTVRGVKKEREVTRSKGPTLRTELKKKNRAPYCGDRPTVISRGEERQKKDSSKRPATS